MRVLLIYILLAISLLLTILMAMLGGVLVLTTEYGETHLYSPYWLLLVQLPMAAGFLLQRSAGAALALGASGGLAFCLALELYVYLQVMAAPAMLTVWFQVAHITVFVLLAALAGGAGLLSRTGEKSDQPVSQPQGSQVGEESSG